MSRTSVGDLLILLLLAGRSCALLKNTESKPLDDGSKINVSLYNVSDDGAYTQQISIAPTSNISFNVTDILPKFSFFILQVHTYQYNVTLSYDMESLYKVSNRSVFGTNIGLFVQLNVYRTAQLYLKNDNVHVVDALLVAIPYDNKAPIPGGCNMEFDTEVAPYEKLFMRDAMIIVDVQPAWVSAVEESLVLCEKNPVKHEMYQMYLPEQDFTPDSYFSAIRNMLTVNDVIENGRKIPASLSSSPMRHAFSAYTGVGSVYVAVATYGNHSAAYVPAFSYGCSPVLYPESCLVLNDSVSKLVCAATFFLGFFSIFFGYAYPKIETTLPILFGGTAIGYAIMVGSTDYDAQSSIGIGIAIGLGVVLVWKILSCWPTCSNLILNLMLGLFIAGIAYFQVPGGFLMIQNDWVFWTLVITVTLTVTLFMTALHCVSFALTCAIFGSYMMILPLDYYFGSSLKYILINLIRRATIPEFRSAIVIPPYQIKEICLTILWIFLALFRLFKQCYPNALQPTRIKVIPHLDILSERTPLIYSRFIGRINVRREY